MGLQEILGVTLLFLVVVVPVLAVTARLALRPLIDAILRLHEAFAEPHGIADAARRITVLEAEVEGLRQEVRKLGEVEAFHSALQPPPGQYKRAGQREE